MTFKFKNDEVEKQLLDVKCLFRKLGKADAKKAIALIEDLVAVPTFIAIFNTRGKPHALQGNLKGSYASSIGKKRRLIFQPEPVELSAEALTCCTCVTILGIGDYHGVNKIQWTIP